MLISSLRRACAGEVPATSRRPPRSGQPHQRGLRLEQAAGAEARVQVDRAVLDELELVHQGRQEGQHRGDEDRGRRDGGPGLRPVAKRLDDEPGQDQEIGQERPGDSPRHEARPAKLQGPGQVLALRRDRERRRQAGRDPDRDQGPPPPGVDRPDEPGGGDQAGRQGGDQVDDQRDRPAEGGAGEAEPEPGLGGRRIRQQRRQDHRRGDAEAEPQRARIHRPGPAVRAPTSTPRERAVSGRRNFQIIPS